MHKVNKIHSAIVVFCLFLVQMPGLCAQENEYLAGSRLLAEIFNPPVDNNARALKFAMILQKAGINSNEINTQSIRDNSVSGAVNVYAQVNCENENPVFVVSCHTDTQKNTSGIIDNWSGCVMAAALCAEFIDKPLKNGFIFVGFGMEEKWQKGSKDFLRQIPEKLRRRITANINLECLGVGSLNTWSNRSSDDLENIFLKASAGADQEINKQVLFNFNSDADSFLRKNIPAITIHSLNSFNNAYINSTYDSAEILDYKLFKDSFIVLVKYLELLDNAEGKFRINDSERDLKPAQCALGESSGRSGHGAKLESLSRGSLEYKAGLREGDIIRKINNQAINNPRDVISVSNSLSEGDTLDLEVISNSDSPTTTRKVKLTY